MVIRQYPRDVVLGIFGVVAALFVGLLLPGGTWAAAHDTRKVHPAKGSDEHLRRLAGEARLSFGATVSAAVLAEGVPEYASIAVQNFNTVTVGEMRWAYTQPQRGVFDFSAAESLVSFAEENGMKVRGHNLLWYNENPAWLENGSFSRRELLQILRQHITAVVSHFRGRVAEWDVVNEPLGPAGGLRESVWLRVIGPTYIKKAFRWAHLADPSAELYINEYGLETAGPKLDDMVSLVRRLRKRHVPIDGVGFQGHFALGGTITRTTGGELAESMARFDDLKVATAVTELDVALPMPPSSADLAAQARVYGKALRACLKTPSCGTFVVWGIYDGSSWVSDFSPGQGAPLLFDEGYRSKPAHARLIRILTRAHRYAATAAATTHLGPKSA